MPLWPEGGLFRSIRKHLNFYRVHLLCFTFVPLILSGVLYACNGQYRISYVDCLFLCVSSVTVCGLATIDLSSLTPLQQVIVFIQMCLGSPVFVSWLILLIRRHYFGKKFQNVIVAAARRNGDIPDEEAQSQPVLNRLRTWLSLRAQTAVREGNSRATSKSSDSKKDKKGGIVRKLKPDMIRRMDDAPQLVNPSGWISDAVPIKKAQTLQLHPASDTAVAAPPRLSSVDENRATGRSVSPPEAKPTRGRSAARRLSDPGTPSRPASPGPANVPMHRYETVHDKTRPQPAPLPNLSNIASRFPRTQTIEFAPSANGRRRGRSIVQDLESIQSGPEGSFDRTTSRPPRNPLQPHASLTTNMTGAGGQSYRPSTKHDNFGGFPMPHHIIKRIVSAAFPDLHRKIARTVTMPVSTTITSQNGETLEGARPVPYITFDAVVGRNSAFHLLTKEQLEELGGVEYRAVNVLLWIVALYHILVQLLAFVIIAPYMSMSKWESDFEEPNLHRPLAAPWYALFQTVSSYTNTGLSLVDQSMIPFQTAYPMIVVMWFLILAGNTAFPIFLRLTIWIASLCVPKSSNIHETLCFLLDHPRRCFIYLFPSHQTWFLVTVLVFLNSTDWFFFMVLDIGNAAIEAVPLGTRFCIGLLQALAVRAAGFSTVSLSVLAPAVKVLYIIMMYVSVYPIAMSVRATNVYEEQSLGIFEEDPVEDDETEIMNGTESRVTAWSRYLVTHARRQLAFDMWWLGLATFLICIIERGPIDDDATYLWFNEFTILFELVSAYGTVGLSLGLPTANYSFSGALKPLSKLILCVVMLRGRHRGLPVAIDRAVMLPNEFKVRDEVEDARSMRRTLTRQSQYGQSMPRTQTYQSGWQTQSMYHNEGQPEGIIKLPTVNDEGSEWRRRNGHEAESDDDVHVVGGGKEESGDDTLTEKGSPRTTGSDTV
ncbi:cation transport protein-domain-containing protein [Schizophyllum amplum]|uniref:Potassium transport protein n=1 Tax=Schizophyllum amplum TaxID=97359 RepID=A0A550CWA8_9AGAR|nr:cation transport protein-domain-containing protein [Auriculariopsis ampla]